MITKGMMTSNKDDWETPQELFDDLNLGWHFTLDVASSHENAKCKRYFTKEDDGLSQRWEGEICWMNPPYGREISKWVRKAYIQSQQCAVVALLPARTDTKWFHDYIYKKDGVRIHFIKGRLKFSSSKQSAPFPSMIIVFDRRGGQWLNNQTHTDYMTLKTTNA